MIYCIWVMKMASRYKFSEEEIIEIVKARKKNNGKQIERRLKALVLRARGMKAEEVASACDYHPAYITTLVAKYRKGGLVRVLITDLINKRRQRAHMPFSSKTSFSFAHSTSSPSSATI